MVAYYSLVYIIYEQFAKVLVYDALKVTLCWVLFMLYRPAKLLKGRTDCGYKDNS